MWWAAPTSRSFLFVFPPLHLAITVLNSGDGLLDKYVSFLTLRGTRTSPFRGIKNYSHKTTGKGLLRCVFLHVR